MFEQFRVLPGFPMFLPIFAKLNTIYNLVLYSLYTKWLLSDVSVMCSLKFWVLHSVYNVLCFMLQSMCNVFSHTIGASKVFAKFLQCFDK